MSERNAIDELREIGHVVRQAGSIHPWDTTIVLTQMYRQAKTVEQRAALAIAIAKVLEGDTLYRNIKEGMKE